MPINVEKVGTLRENMLQLLGMSDDTPEGEEWARRVRAMMKGVSARRGDAQLMGERSVAGLQGVMSDFAGKFVFFGDEIHLELGKEELTIMVIVGPENFVRFIMAGARLTGEEFASQVSTVFAELSLINGMGNVVWRHDLATCSQSAAMAACAKE
jgi:hypothetical protein